MAYKKINNKIYIYGLVDPRNNKIFYVGYAENLKRRFAQHLNINGKKREKNTYKKNIINKILGLGLKPEMKIIDECDKLFNSDSNMFEHQRLEIYHIKKYRDNGFKLTNLTDGGDGGCTYLKPVYQYSEDGKFLKRYDSVNEVANTYNVNAGLISHVIDQRGKKSYRATYLFLSKEKADLFVFKDLVKHCTPIIQYSFDGKFIKEYKSQKEASNLTNIGQPTINCCLKKKTEQAGGYLWYYKDKKPTHIIKHVGKYSKMLKPIIQYDLNNNMIAEFISIGEAKRTLNISGGLIVTNLKGITKTCKGFIFKYKNTINKNNN